MVSKEEREAKATLWLQRLQRLQGAEAAERVARSCTSLPARRKCSTKRKRTSN